MAPLRYRLPALLIEGSAPILRENPPAPQLPGAILYERLELLSSVYVTSSINMYVVVIVIVSI